VGDITGQPGSLRKGPATLLVVLSALLWATMGVFVRSMSGYALGPMEIVAVRALVTAALMLALLAARRRALLRVHMRDLWCFFGTGVCSIIFFNYCYFRTIMLTSLSVAAVLLYTAPALVMLMSIPLFGERPSGAKLAALGMAFAGCVLVTGIGSEIGTRLSVTGVLTGLGAGLGYALYSIFGRFALQRGYSPLTITAYTFVFASLGVGLLVDFPALGAKVAAGGAGLAAWCVGLGVITTVLPYVLYTMALQRIEASRASIIASVEPVAATLLGVALYREGLSVWGGAGVALVVASIALLNANQKGPP